MSTDTADSCQLKDQMLESVGWELAQAMPDAVRACRAMLGHEADAEDAVSAAVEDALAQARAGFAPRSWRAWLVRISRRRAVDLVRSRDAGRRYESLYAVRETSTVADFTTQIDDAAEARWFRRQSEGLPASGQAVLASMERVDSVGDAASELGVTKRAAEGHLLRARQKLHAAWLTTLSLLGWIGGKWRQAVLTATPAVALAALGLLIAPFTQPVNPGVDPLHAPTAVLREPTLSAPKVIVATKRPPAPRRVSQQPPRTAPTENRDVIRIQTPVGDPRVYKEHREGSSDPLNATLECVQRFTIQVGVHIGC